MKTTHTLALMEVSNATFVEVIGKLIEAGYNHAIDYVYQKPLEPLLDMSGIMMVRSTEAVVDEQACRTAYENHYHKVRAELSYDEWRALWVVGKAPGQRPALKRSDVDLIARGCTWERGDTLAKEACAQAGLNWNDRVAGSSMAINVLNRLAQSAHKEGFKLGVERAFLAATNAPPPPKGWLPMATAPKDHPILAYCQHVEGSIGGDGLSLYEAHSEGLSHVKDGPHVVVWGGGFDDRSYEDQNAAWLPDWWFRAGSDFEEAANPVGWLPIPLERP